MKTAHRPFAAGIVVLLAALCAATASAQEFRATVTGRVTDPNGLAVPGVTVSAGNQQTAEIAVGVTTGEGAYSIPFLRPGMYNLSAELTGFKKVTQPNVQLEVGQTSTVNFQLQLGQVTEELTVTAESPMLDAGKADRGMVIDNDRVNELPLNARNPFMLSYLSPGVTYNGPAIYQRPFDNGAIADWSINGGQNRNNEFLLDGAPNNSIQGGNNIAYVPPVDSVAEFKIVTNSYDAQYGRTAGGVVNVSLKSGTNSLHGTAYEFARRKAFDSNEYFFKVNKREKPDHKLDQYGFQVGGPIRVPGIYDGRNKTFFMFNYEGYKEATPNPSTYTVPTDAQLRGDFSNLRDPAGRLVTIYDPATGRQEGGSWLRDPFPNNIIPANRIDPMAQRLTQYFLRPNTTPTAGDPWRNNYLFVPNLAFDTFRNIASKFDQNVSDKSKVFVRYAYNKRTETRYTNGITSGPAQDGQLPLERLNHTGVGDWVRTMSSSLVLNVRAGLNQYLELARSDPGLGFNPSELGFPASLVSQLPNKVFPRINVTDYQGLGRAGRNSETTTGFSLQPNFSWVKGSHTLRGGLDMRMTWYTREVNGNLFVLSFDRRFTQRQFNSGDALSGNSVASFLLGAASGGQVDNNFYPTFRWNYQAPWVQDDWKVTDKLTVNVGVRWDLNTPVFEEDNRLNYTFDSQVVNPVSARVNRQILPGGVRGGLEFAGVDGNPKYPYTFDKNNIQPRVGFAYLLTDKTVLRGGYGLYYLNVVGISASSGFGASTPLLTSQDSDRTSTYPLSNPFSQGIVQAPGSSLGLETFLGRGFSFSNTDFVNPYVHQFSLGVQRELPWRTTVELSYVGSRTRDEQNQWGGFNEPPVELRNECDPTKGSPRPGYATRPAYCNELLPSPFFQVRGFEGTTRFTNPTLSRYDLSRPFPQFGGITMLDRNDGRIWYNSAQLLVNKRMSDGITVAGTYTLSKMIEENGGGNTIGGTATNQPLIGDVDRIVQRAPYESDRKHRVTISGVFRLPFGRDRRFMGNANAIADGLLGGWEVAGMWLFNSGRPWALPNNVFYVKDATIKNVDYNAPVIRGVKPCVAQMSDAGVVTMQGFSIAAGCTEPNFIIRPNFTPRSTAFRDDQIRRPPFYQFDINFAKTTRIAGNVRLQIRFEVFNLLNQVVYDERNYENNAANPLFGSIDRTVVRQSNFPRYGQLGLKLIW